MVWYKTFFGTLYRHKKKSLALVGFSAWGAHYLHNKILEDEVWMNCFRQCAVEGRKNLQRFTNPRKVIVLLNQHANRGKANKLFENRILPSLALAGLDISIVKSDSERYFKDIGGVVDTGDADALVVVGGNATAQDVVTGIMRGNVRPARPPPVVLVPAGVRSDSVLSMLSLRSLSVDDITSAILSVLKQPAPVDVVAVQSEEGKTVYGLSRFRIGSLATADNKAPKYWYLWRLKSLMAKLVLYMKGSYKPLQVQIEYTVHCSGCNRCMAAAKADGRTDGKWWRNDQIALGRQAHTATPDYSAVFNADCGVWHQLRAEAVEVECALVTDSDRTRCLQLNLISHDLSFKDFCFAPYSAIAAQRLLCDRVNLRLVQHNDSQIFIDEEPFEYFPVSIYKVPKCLNLFVPNNTV